MTSVQHNSLAGVDGRVFMALVSLVWLWRKLSTLIDIVGLCMSFDKMAKTLDVDGVVVALESAPTWCNHGTGQLKIMRLAECLRFGWPRNMCLWKIKKSFGNKHG